MNDLETSEEVLSQLPDLNAALDADLVELGSTFAKVWAHRHDPSLLSPAAQSHSARQRKEVLGKRSRENDVEGLEGGKRARFPPAPREGETLRERRIRKLNCHRG